MLIVVPTPPVNATFPCCPGCEVLNEPVTELVPIEEEHPVSLPRDNQGRGARMAAVHSGQRACRGGRSDRQGYGGVARMQPSIVPRREYPDRCEREQSRLGQFAKLGLAVRTWYLVELFFRPNCLITRRLPITFLRFFLFSYDFMTL